MSGLRVRIVLGLVASLLVSCSKPPPVGRTVLAGSPTNEVLILPLNVPIVMPEELQTMSPYVWEALQDYLREQGKDLKTIAFQTVRTAWIDAIRSYRETGQQGSESGFDAVARRVVVWLAAHAEFDIVIIPSLFVKEANIFGTSASWDGVEHGLEYEGGEGPIPMNSMLEGAAPAASLHAVVLDAEGNKIQEAMGGLELLVRVKVIRLPQPPYDTGKFEFVTRTDLFADDEKLREGIGVALSPIFAPFARSASE